MTDHGAAAVEAAKCLEAGELDDSRTNEASPRDALLAALFAALPACLAVGDIEAARVATDAIGRLLGASGSTGSGRVIDLAARRGRVGA